MLLCCEERMKLAAAEAGSKKEIEEAIQKLEEEQRTKEKMAEDCVLPTSGALIM